MPGYQQQPHTHAQSAVGQPASHDASSHRPTSKILPATFPRVFPLRFEARSSPVSRATLIGPQQGSGRSPECLVPERYARHFRCLRRPGFLKRQRHTTAKYIGGTQPAPLLPARADHAILSRRVSLEIFSRSHGERTKKPSRLQCHPLEMAAALAYFSSPQKGN